MGDNGLGPIYSLSLCYRGYSIHVSIVPALERPITKRLAEVKASLCWESPKQRFTRRIYRTQHIVVLMSMIYYSKRKQSTINKGKKHMGWGLGIHLQESSLSGITQDVLNSYQQWVLSTWAKYCLLGKLIRDSVPTVSFGSLSHGLPLPSMYQNSRVLEGREVFGINHCCSHSSGTVGCPYWLG